jgi:hypothetical protein
LLEKSVDEDQGATGQAIDMGAQEDGRNLVGCLIPSKEQGF